MLIYNEVETALNKIAESGEMEINNIERLASYILSLYNVRSEEQLLEELEALIAEEYEAFVGRYESEANFAFGMASEFIPFPSDDYEIILEIDWQGTYYKTFQYDYFNDGKNFWRNV